MHVLTFRRTIITTKSIMAVTMSYTTFDETTGNISKMAKGIKWSAKVCTHFSTTATTCAFHPRTSLSLRFFSPSVVRTRASCCKQTMASCRGTTLFSDETFCNRYRYFERHFLHNQELSNVVV